MTCVKENQPVESGTHALVIGVGRYPHLKGGSGLTFANHAEMGQLESPPHSARQVCQWLVGSYHNPNKPLRSLEVLISGPDQTVPMPGAGAVDVDPATMAKIEQAIVRWYGRGNQHAENLLFFFFCGHGVSSGSEQSLLAEDFGCNTLSPFQNALSFWEFHVGMRGCKARQQCYFLDACRTVSRDYLRKYGFSGQPVVDGVPSQNFGDVRAPVFAAADLGAPAYGEADKPSFFTRALLAAFDGAGSFELDDDWVVVSDTLTLGINAFLDRMVVRKLGLNQVAMQPHPSKQICLHYLSDVPRVPVDVACRPESSMPHARLDCLRNGIVVDRRPPGGQQLWEIELPLGEYEFRASFADGRPAPQPKTRYVHPPWKRITIDCP